jgi:hypothetical protein|mmetsp:Transcript_10011/g.16915  ORF Transcript_10011/g.16915 Transcript_10011/m.16915 type:complete len:99 (-) Transcript_10011:518-814(-)
MKRCGAFFVSAQGKQALMRFRICESSFLRVTTNQFRVEALQAPQGAGLAAIPEGVDLAALYRWASLRLSAPAPVPSFSVFRWSVVGPVTISHPMTVGC